MSERSHNVRIRVSAFIQKDDKVLFIAHKKDGKVYWLLPGGGVDFCESAPTALKRELKEELNIDIDVKDVALISDSISLEDSFHNFNVCFFADHLSGELKVGEEERLFDYKYFSAEEISSLKIIPPFNDKIIDILNKKNSSIYVGSRWIDL